MGSYTKRISGCCRCWTHTLITAIAFSTITLITWTIGGLTIHAITLGAFAVGTGTVVHNTSFFDWTLTII